MAKQAQPIHDSLGTFDGHQVAGAKVKITNAGDGLSQAMSTEPVALHHKQVVNVLLQCEVSKVSFDPMKESDLLLRVHVLRAGVATMISDDIAAPIIAEQKRKNLAAKGVIELPLDDGDLDPE